MPLTPIGGVVFTPDVRDCHRRACSNMSKISLARPGTKVKRNVWVSGPQGIGAGLLRHRPNLLCFVLLVNFSKEKWYSLIEVAYAQLERDRRHSDGASRRWSDGLSGSLGCLTSGQWRGARSIPPTITQILGTVVARRTRPRFNSESQLNVSCPSLVNRNHY
jgi:hypothetical protein